MRLLPGLLLAACAWAPIAAQAGDAEPNDYPETIQREPPMIGMFPGGVPEDVAKKQGLDPGNGVLVLGVMPNSMAQGMGLEPGDVVLSFNGTPVNNYDEIVSARDRNRAGDPAEMVFVRDGQRRSATGTLGAWPHADDANNGGPAGMFRRAADAARREAERRRDADLQQGVDELRDELAALREELDRRPDEIDGPWRLAWSSHAISDLTLAAEPTTPATAAADVSDSGPAWRLEWSNARGAMTTE